MARAVSGFNIGDPVDVYDEDVRDWVSGIVESIGTHPDLGPTIAVTTDQTYQGRPLKYLVAADDSLIRRTR